MVRVRVEPKWMVGCRIWIILMVNQFRLHYAKNIVHFQAAIQISRILEEEEEENNRSEHFLKNPPETLDY